LELVLGELDTITDFTTYIIEKERAIEHFDALSYCGEEDLLAHYIFSFDEEAQQRSIGLTVKDQQINGLHIGEGEWDDFVKSGPYKRRQDANKRSYFWDRLLQRTGRNALAGVLGGNDEVFNGKSAIHEMAKETRFARRILSERLLGAVEAFPNVDAPLLRHLTYAPSLSPEKGYVFLQLKAPMEDYDDYRQKRQALLEIACGMARVKFPQLRQVIGIAVEPPRLFRIVAEDFVLFDCSEWSAEQEETYREANAPFRFFETKHLSMRIKETKSFPMRPIQ